MAEVEQGTPAPDRGSRAASEAGDERAHGTEGEVVVAHQRRALQPSFASKGAWSQCR